MSLVVNDDEGENNGRERREVVGLLYLLVKWG